VIPLPRPADSVTWTLLRDGVPITLLCDLLFDDGPPSREILAAEALEDDVRRCHPDPLATAHPAGRSTEPPGISISTA
jgi:hypothetical protein